MWIFMNLCYILLGFTWLNLVIALVQSQISFLIWNANHISFIIFTCILYSLTVTVVIFFFVGTGISIKEYALEHNLSPDLYKKALGVKLKMYPPVLWNILVMIIVFVAAGAADTDRIPHWLYQIILVYGVWHYSITITKVHPCFKASTQIILDMSGIDKKVT